ncbi:facilitated trehalose transporter Tret1-2 homolog isoform X2 [Culicoides brevitarsis]|uniref:facilitated trehalose transporter Tret1-2 homolog isoform X2 n=1 Tax=Culicoides brevitarsis TaxID=469753 RepID=UPI00307B9B5F
MPNLESHRGLIREDLNEKSDDAFREIIVSCRSLSKYESNTFKSALPQVICSIIAASFHIVIGIALSFSAIFIPQAESPDSDLPVTQTQSSWVASIIVLVGPVASISAGFIMDAIGRLNTIKLAAIPAIIGWILIAAANNVAMVLIGRVLTGFGCIIGTSPAVVYITEVARPDLRSSLISMGPTLASLGMVIGYTKGALLNWRYLSWISIAYCVVPAVLIQIFVVESPVWLVGKGRMEDAARGLKHLYKNYPQPDHTNESLADMHLNALIREKEAKRQERMRRNSKSDDENDMKTRPKWTGLLKPTGYKPLLILSGLFILQQFSGIYITLFYAVTFFQEIGTDIDAYTCSILFGVTRLIMSVSNAWLLNKYKRRALLMVSSIGMAICMAFSGLATYMIKTGHDTPSWIPVIFLLLYVCTSMIGLLTIPWTMTAELFPNEIRGIAHSISYSLSNIFMFAAVQTYRPFQAFLGSPQALQWFFAAVSVVAFFYALFIIPETHGKKLQEIEAYFTKPAKSGSSTKRAPEPKKENLIMQPRLNTISETEVMLKDDINNKT